jgi:hypothetical protein
MNNIKIIHSLFNMATTNFQELLDSFKEVENIRHDLALNS